jgi:hypothetical protein
LGGGGAELVGEREEADLRIGAEDLLQPRAFLLGSKPSGCSMGAGSSLRIRKGACQMATKAQAAGCMSS